MSTPDFKAMALKIWEEISNEAFNCQELNILEKHLRQVHESALASHIEWPSDDDIFKFISGHLKPREARDLCLWLRANTRIKAPERLSDEEIDHLAYVTENFPKNDSEGLGYISGYKAAQDRLLGEKK